MVGAVGETASMKRRKLWKTGEDGLCCSSSASKLGWIPCHCWKNGVKPPLFLFVSFLLSATPQTGGNGQGV